MIEQPSRFSTRISIPGTPATTGRIARAIHVIESPRAGENLIIPKGLTARRDDEYIYYDVINTVFFQQWFSGAVLGRHPQTNKRKDDHFMTVQLNDADLNGRMLQEMVGYSKLDIFVAQNKHKAGRRIDHILENPSEESRTIPEVVVNIKEPPIHMAADIAIQMLGHTGQVQDQRTIGDFVSIMSPSLREIFTERELIVNLIRARYPLIELLNPSENHREVVINALADELVDAALDNYEE